MMRFAIEGINRLKYCEFGTERGYFCVLCDLFGCSSAVSGFLEFSYIFYFSVKLGSQAAKRKTFFAIE